MRTSIELKNMRFYAYHGLLPHEKTNGNIFVVNIRLDADFSRAIGSDCLEHTVNYAALYDWVKAEMAVPGELLEQVAGRIFNRLKASFPQIAALEVRLAKLNPPVDGEMEAAEIIVSDWPSV